MYPLLTYLIISVALDSEDDPKIPFSSMFISLLLIIVPTIIGLLVRHFNRQWKLGEKFLYEWINKIASIGGLIALISTVVLGFVINCEQLVNSSYLGSLFGMAVVLQPSGHILGFAAARLMGRTREEQITISMETGCQNLALAFAVINLSFQGDFATEAFAFPLIYGLVNLFWSPLFTLVFRFVLGKPKNNSNEEEDPEKPVDAEAGGTEIVDSEDGSEAAAASEDNRESMNVPDEADYPVRRRSSVMKRQNLEGIDWEV